MEESSGTKAELGQEGDTSPPIDSIIGKGGKAVQKEEGRKCL